MNCSIDKDSEIHSVVFRTDPPNSWTPKLSRAWLKKHKLTRRKEVDRTPNTIRYRIIDPECFKSFSTTVVKDKTHGTINLVIGWYIVRSPKEIFKKKERKRGGVSFTSRLKKRKRK